ncbi:hypothetical protein V5O48_008254, partial [Marasmius crinis-equi]
MPAPSTASFIAYSFNLVALSAALGVVLDMPLGLPSTRVNKSEIGYSISPEDYTTVWEWMTFSWVHPLVQRGKSAALNENDVWNLSPTCQSRPIFIKSNNIPQSTLIRRIWAANSLDLILDATFTVASSCLSYLNPFFLNHILSSIDKNPVTITPADRSNAYIFACLMFLSSLAKAESDVQHLCFGRRAATRIWSELMAAIYDKALKRKDFSGAHDKSKVEEGNNDPTGDAFKVQQSSKNDPDKKGEPKAGADVGKIVNLMASDANAISQAVTGLYLIYGSPLEIVLGCTYLYQLLGWSAFAGFAVLIAEWPLNTLLAKRSFRIQKGSMTARDKRTGVLYELIGAMRLTKFFAWEERWIDRVMDARRKELKWVVKARVNSIMFYTLWLSAPILLSIVSFAAYVAQGNGLTVSKAFAPRSLEKTKSQSKFPLSSRISRSLTSGSEEEGLGLENATLKWNEFEKERKDEGKKGKWNATRSPTASGNGSTIAPSSTTSETASRSDLNSELQDVSIVFLEGELTVVTGPTASGKTALPKAVLGEMTWKDWKRKVDPCYKHITIYRSRLTFIPQGATLFSGTLRDNLDPSNEYSDAEFLAVLYRVQIISQDQLASQSSSRVPSDAESPGTTRPPSDHTTIREQFTDSLLLTVAHRLRTVIDYDRLIVLDKGQMVEFDTPSNLIRKQDGIFRNMCLKSGTFAELEATAAGG